MAKITTLTDESGNVLYPVTKTECVVDIANDFYNKTQSDNKFASKDSVGYEYYASYTLQTGVDSYRLQICDAGDFDKYNYKIIFSTPEVGAGTVLYFRLGNSSSDLDRSSTECGFAKYGIERDGQTGSVTPMGYYAEGTHEFNYSNARTGEITASFDLLSRTFGSDTYAYLIGQSGRPYNAGDYNVFAFDMMYSSNVNSITHFHLYAGANFVNYTGYMTVYRRKK